MKRLLIAALCAALLSCNNNSYNISGKYTTSDGTEVYLIDLENNDTLGVAPVVGNAFSFKGKLREPFFAYVGQGRERVRFILEGGTVSVDIDERTESGTPMVDAYNDFHRRFYAFDALRNKERTALSSRKEELSPEAFNEEWDALNNKYIQLQGQLTDSIVRANRDNLLGAMALDDLATRDTALFMALYKEFPENIQSSMLVRGDYENISLQNRTAPGKMFTDYLIKGGNPDGTDARLSDYVGKGKYILLDHWASWCGPCKAEIPYIKKTWEAFAGSRFDVVGVAVSDAREDTEQALKTLDMPWRHIIDAQRIPTELYNISAIPHLILFAPDGTILKRGLRGEQIYATISEILSAE